jgi:hypothetical protein
MNNYQKLEKAVNWFFSTGYNQVCKNKNAPTQSKISSAYSSIMKVSEIMEMEPSEVILFTYEGKMNGKKK